MYTWFASEAYSVSSGRGRPNPYTDGIAGPLSALDGQNAQTDMVIADISKMTQRDDLFTYNFPFG
ncbi:hypothetical protein [Desulfoscipio gibsoniae]